MVYSEMWLKSLFCEWFRCPHNSGVVNQNINEFLFYKQKSILIMVGKDFVFNLLFFSSSENFLIDSRDAKLHSMHSMFLLKVWLIISARAALHFFISLQAIITLAPKFNEIPKLIKLIFFILFSFYKHSYLFLKAL